MPGPAGKKGMVKRRFGPTGGPVSVPAKAVARAKARGGRLYEDGSVGGSGGLRGSKASPGPRGKSIYPGDLRGSKASPGPDPNPRAMERASPNARFKRGDDEDERRTPGSFAKGARMSERPPTPQPAAVAKALPRPPSKRLTDRVQTTRPYDEARAKLVASKLAMPAPPRTNQRPPPTRR